MIDFTSSLYLGMTHSSAVLPRWSALTSGRPAALEEPHGAISAASALACLQHQRAATLMPSTLHLFCDLLHLLTRTRRTSLLLDEGAG